RIPVHQPMWSRRSSRHGRSRKMQEVLSSCRRALPGRARSGRRGCGNVLRQLAHDFFAVIEVFDQDAIALLMRNGPPVHGAVATQSDRVAKGKSDHLAIAIRARHHFIIERAPAAGLFVARGKFARPCAELFEAAFETVRLVQWPPRDVPLPTFPKTSRAP